MDDDQGTLHEDGNPNFWAMIRCITVARKMGQQDPDVALLARALTAVVNGRAAAADVWLTKLESAADKPAPQPAEVGQYTAYSVVNGNRMWVHAAASRSQTQRVAETMVTSHGRERVEVYDPDGHRVYVLTRAEVERERSRWRDAVERERRPADETKDA